MSALFTPLTLPNGTSLPNRICKAAMEENMAEAGQLPGQTLHTLYTQWAEGGAGLILTGNVMVDPKALTGPGGVVLEDGTLNSADARTRFESWAQKGKSGGGQFWMQISHPGRQVYASQGQEAVSASATKVAPPGAEKMFVAARALTDSEIHEMIARFAQTAALAEQSGFDGIQVHAAHGYLLSQFLSPLANLRTDQWGGSLENRARLLIEIIRAVRAKVSPSFGVGVKLNSADFQRGGFNVDDAKAVVQMLSGLGVDLLELSGGNYESPAMAGAAEDMPTSTLAREMYFIDFAKDIAATADMPVMVTGGVTKLETAQAALTSGGVDIIGIARAMAYNPALPNDWAAGRNTHVPLPVITFKSKLLRVFSGMAMTKAQLHRMGAGKPPKAKQNPLLAIVKDRIRIGKLTKRYKAWMAAK